MMTRSCSITLFSWWARRSTSEKMRSEKSMLPDGWVHALDSWVYLCVGWRHGCRHTINYYFLEAFIIMVQRWLGRCLHGRIYHLKLMWLPCVQDIKQHSPSLTRRHIQQSICILPVPIIGIDTSTWLMSILDLHWHVFNTSLWCHTPIKWNIGGAILGIVFDWWTHYYSEWCTNSNS